MNFEKGNQLELIGGASYLASLIDSVPTAANIEYYAKIVKEKAILRKLINTSTEIITKSYRVSGGCGSRFSMRLNRRSFRSPKTG